MQTILSPFPGTKENERKNKAQSTGVRQVNAFRAGYYIDMANKYIKLYIVEQDGHQQRSTVTNIIEIIEKKKKYSFLESLSGKLFYSLTKPTTWLLKLTPNTLECQGKCVPANSLSRSKVFFNCQYKTTVLIYSH